MSWMQKLYQTYNAALAHNLKNTDAPLTPVGHTLQTAHIVVVIDICRHGSLCQSRFNCRIILVGQHIAHTTSLMNLCFISCMERLPAWNYICNAINR